MTPPKRDTASSIHARLILAPQSAGRIGKSTAAEAIVGWATFAGIRKAVLDLDGEHRTISNRYPDIATVLPGAASTEDGWQQLLRALDPPPAPLLIADMPAQAAEFLLHQLVDGGGLQYFQRIGIRLTCLIFAVADQAARQSAVRTVRDLGESVDWLVVQMPGPKALDEKWKSSKLAARLSELGAGEMVLPRLSRPTLDDYEKLVKDSGRWLSFQDAIPKLPTASQIELDLWRNRALVACEDNAAVLIPDAGLIKNKAQRGEVAPVRTGSTGLDLDL